jgi:hypothetical protein
LTRREEAKAMTDENDTSLITKTIGAGIVAAGLSCTTVAADERYGEICNASAAVALGDDHFVVGEDEKSSLYVYRRGAPQSVDKIKLGHYLGQGETDIEGAARIGNRIYWITSHGRRGSDGLEQESRRRFFATDIIETSAGPSVRELSTPPYTQLLGDLLAEARFAPLGLADAAQHKPESEHGFNIEGLAATTEGQLLLGFRNPRPGGKAIVIPLINPQSVIDKGQKPVFGDAILLNLEQRGVRSIDRIGDSYLIAAGPFGNAAPPGPASTFALYRWSGRAADAPLKLDADLSTINAESMFAIAGTNQIVVLSDDGDLRSGPGEPKCADLPREQRGFRARTLNLP